ncbi:MAG: tRNA adenosine(34) deaminase TadA [Candidatus Latescibacterota bacterium]
MPVRDDHFWMRRAFAEAQKAFGEGEVPVGAVLVRAGNVVAAGHNQVETSGDPFAHAEIVAMRHVVERAGRWVLQECTLYVTLEPCVMCVGAAVLARVPRLVFGAREEKTGACESAIAIPNDAALAANLVVTGGIEAERCKEILQEFFRKRRDEKN